MHVRHVIRRIVLVVTTATVLALPLSVEADSLSAKKDDYFVFKSGVYYPGARFELNDFTKTGSRSQLQTRNGFNGEIAIGHYFTPLFGMELGAGLFESKASPAGEPGSTRLRVMPLRLSGKVFVPIGPVEPYGELGIGAYVTKLEVNGNLGGFTGTTRITYGFHGGVGLNVYFTETFFVGIEGRYLQARPNYGGQPVRLNGYTATIDFGFRY